MSNQSDAEELFELLDISVRYCGDLKEIYSECVENHQNLKKQSAPEDKIEDAFHLCMKYGFKYLQEKFRILWFETTERERTFRYYRPDWDYFSPTDFELLVQCVLYFLEDKTYALTKASHDNGVDLQHQETIFQSGLSFGMAKTVVQCKLYHNSVSVTEIRDFFGVITAQVALGYFFTTGTITKSGIKFMESANRSSFANMFHFVGRKEFRELIELASIVIESWDDYAESPEDDEEEILSKINTAKKKAAAIILRQSSSSSQLNLF